MNAPIICLFVFFSVVTHAQEKEQYYSSCGVSNFLVSLEIKCKGSLDCGTSGKELIPSPEPMCNGELADATYLLGSGNLSNIEAFAEFVEQELGSEGIELKEACMELLNYEGSFSPADEKLMDLMDEVNSKWTDLPSMKRWKLRRKFGK